MTLPTGRGRIVVQRDGGDALAIQTAVGHVQGEDVGVYVAQDTLPQHQVHAVASSGGGGGVQHQSLILQCHGTPALRDGDGPEKEILITASFPW